MHDGYPARRQTQCPCCALSELCATVAFRIVRADAEARLTADDPQAIMIVSISSAILSFAGNAENYSSKVPLTKLSQN